MRLTVLVYIAAMGFFCPVLAEARSEISGHISTDPARPGQAVKPGGAEDAPGGSGAGGQADPVLPVGGSSLIFDQPALGAGKPNAANGPGGISGVSPQVLGFDRLPDNTLVRDESKRIYVIKGEIKQVVWDLKELWQYRGRPILDLEDSELSLYPTRRFFDGRLIRSALAREIYFVSNGRKQHVKSLSELRARFFGQKIYNVGEEEFAIYS